MATTKLLFSVPVTQESGKVNPSRRVTVSGVRPVSCVEVLLYTNPDSDITVMRGLIRDQYNSYVNSPTTSGAVISIGEVYNDTSLTKLPVPAVSAVPLIASSVASVVWWFLLVVVSFKARSP